MTPTADTISMLASAEEALEFWQGVPSHAAYWQGARDTLRALHSVEHIMMIPAVRQYAEEHAEPLEAEIRRLKDELAFTRSLMAERMSGGKIVQPWKRGSTFAAIWAYATSVPEFSSRDLTDALDHLENRYVRQSLWRLCDAGHIIRHPPKPYVYRVNHNHPYTPWKQEDDE